MKERRSNKSYNSRLIRWVDCLLPFDFKIEHTPGAEKGLVDKISRQPNQKAKVKNKLRRNLRLQHLPSFATGLQQLI